MGTSEGLPRVYRVGGSRGAFLLPESVHEGRSLVRGRARARWDSEGEGDNDGEDEVVHGRVRLTRRRGDEGTRRWLEYAPEGPKRKRCKPRDQKGGSPKRDPRGEAPTRCERRGPRGGALTTAYRGRRERWV